MQQALVNDIINTIWKKYDLDENGYLCPKETDLLVESVLAGAGKKITEANKKDLIAELDIDKDGKITKEEFKQHLLKVQWGKKA